MIDCQREIDRSIRNKCMERQAHGYRNLWIDKGERETRGYGETDIWIEGDLDR